jgi:tripartite-type tricarboxylate transporter receptor subunit TctC
MMPGLAHGQSQQPIRLNVPFSPGTGPDLLARILSEELRQRWNHPVIVENKPGASGNIGTQAAARTAPDGQNLLVTVNTFVMNASLYPNIPYDPEKDFVPIAEIATGALALVVHPSLKVNTLAELIALARSKPGEINYASPGRGTPQHLAMELFKLTAQINLTHIPYPGSAGAVKDIAGGHVSAMFLPVHTALPLAETGQIRILAVGSEKGRRRRQMSRRSQNSASKTSMSIYGTAFLRRPTRRRRSSTATIMCSTRSWRSRTSKRCSTSRV